MHRRSHWPSLDPRSGTQQPASGAQTRHRQPGLRSPGSDRRLSISSTQSPSPAFGKLAVSATQVTCL